MKGIAANLTNNYSEYIKRLRDKIGITQQALADRLGVSFATVNRWENNQTKPSNLYWHQLRQLEMRLTEEHTGVMKKEDNTPPILDFTADPEIVKVLAEGERLSYGHMMNPAFATEISSIDPLPHQRIAVYDHMLHQPRLRFLLADDAGAGKTIMSGLYIREMLLRRLLNRILIVPPAGLIGNWQRELLTLFNLPFRIVTGSDARADNPFLGETGNRIIISMDTLSSPRMFARLRDPGVIPYDLVIFDEAHKLAADRGNDLRIRKTDRYSLAEAMAGVRSHHDHFQLNWSAHHLLLLTATPHMGKDYPYYALWRLLEPEILSTPEAFAEYPAEQRRTHFIRRSKEELVFLDGRPLFPSRISDTLGYELSQGEVSEQTLYDETTEYLRFVYNKAKMLNQEAARLAMGIFQRRMASSTYALLRSLERRIAKLEKLIADIQDGKISTQQLLMFQQHIGEQDDVFDAKTADDEEAEEAFEENEVAEDRILQGVVASSLTDLLAEKEQVEQLLDLARRVHDGGQESKFERLRQILEDAKFLGEKFIVFTEHRDTMDFIVKRLGGMGYTGQIAQIHGGMHYLQREDEVERFRQPHDQGGARFLICTDAAGEGINLQFCWIMINYDVPWNPARLEQRMGRIHRYGQKHDPVVIMNLVAPSTREGKVLKVLLDKLEKIRKELHSDKVFDCIGHLFEGVSIKQYMELAITEDPDEVARRLDGHLTIEQMKALDEREKALYGAGGDVVHDLPRLRAIQEQEIYFRLLPGYVRQYILKVAPLVDIAIDGDMDGIFSFRALRHGALDPLFSILEFYTEKSRSNFTVARPLDRKAAIWLHPGEPVFDKFCAMASERLAEAGTRGAIFIDPCATKPYLFHIALLSIIRRANPEILSFARQEVLDCRLIGVRQDEGSEIAICPVEHLLLLKGGYGLPATAQRLAVAAVAQTELARAYLTERIAREMALAQRKILTGSIPEREVFIRRGFDYQEAELAAARAKHFEKARSGNRKAIEALDDVKRLQRELVERRENALEVLRREPELVVPAGVTFVVHALVVPSSDPADLGRHDANVEGVAMQVAQAFEETAGAKVIAVHTPELARRAGLPDNPGFDLLSIRPGDGKRCIEVKGRAETGDIEVSANEWAKACNMREGYWLYAVYNCGSPTPHLVRVQDPFGNLLAKAKGSMLIHASQIMEASEGNV
jgi:SNF2 family DNA or RNA helicase